MSSRRSGCRINADQRTGNSRMAVRQTRSHVPGVKSRSVLVVLIAIAAGIGILILLPRFGANVARVRAWINTPPGYLVVAVLGIICAIKLFDRLLYGPRKE